MIVGELSSHPQQISSNRLSQGAFNRIPKIFHFKEEVESWFEFVSKLDFFVSTRIHGGMAGISNGVPMIMIPTDLRILELVDAMKLPHISFEDAMNKEFKFWKKFKASNLVEKNLHRKKKEWKEVWASELVRKWILHLVGKIQKQLLINLFSEPLILLNQFYKYSQTWQ